jgi:RNA polymerase sigma-70 factor (ECF subfamily)
MSAANGTSDSSAEGNRRRRESRAGAQLVERFQGGEREQPFADLYKRYHRPIERHLTSLLGDPHAAEDAVHEVFERAYVALPRLELGPGKPLWAWLYTIARNYAMNELQRHSHRRLESWDPVLLDREREATAGFAEDPASRWQRIADLRELALLLDDLPPDQCQAVVLTEVVGLDSRAAAKEIGATPANVRQMKRRALAALHKSLISDGRGLTGTSLQRMPMLAPLRGLPVLARRRFARGNAGPTAAFGRGGRWR